MEFTTNYENYFNLLTDMACHYLEKENAKDVVQDVLVKMWEHPERRTFIQDLYAYAASAVRNRCLDQLKHAHHVRQYYDHAKLEMQYHIEAQSPYKILEYEDTRQHINHAIGLLPPRCRQVFLLSRMENMRYEEIAVMLGISKNTVEAHMTNALARLKEKIRVA